MGIRTVVYGRTKTKCQQNVDAKIRNHWHPITPIKLDDSYIGGRWVCVMEYEEKEHTEKTEKAKRFLGQY
jgi:hypothetical protein